MAEKTYFVKMYKDGTYTCNVDSRNEAEQSTMELEYIVPKGVSEDPNKIRVSSPEDPKFLFDTPARPVIWSWVKVSDTLAQEDQVAQAVATADAFRKNMLASGRWDKTVNAYKEQYNVTEV